MSEPLHEQDALLAEVARTVPDTGQDALFDVEQSWEAFWWGMVDFSAEKMTPAYEMTVKFPSLDDYREFKDINGFRTMKHQNTAWWPPRQRLGVGEYVWEGTPSTTRYPVYIPSKGRHDVATAPALLSQAGIDWRVVVEETEADSYRATYGADRVLVLPFHDLGQGSIPARNWIWQHAKDNGHRWHWIVDDNVATFHRAHMNRRLSVKRSSAPLRMVEDFADRYDNLAFAGLSALSFMPEGTTSPLTLNTRVYSVTLINTTMDYRWRGRYNEDTDICLRALKDGWATALFRSFLFQKLGVTKGDGKSGLKGGNTDTVYAVNDHRRSFAEALREQHPDVTTVTWKFDRWHHHVDYSGFRNNALTLRENVTPIKGTSDYGLKLVRGKSNDAGAEL